MVAQPRSFHRMHQMTLKWHVNFFITLQQRSYTQFTVASRSENMRAKADYVRKKYSLQIFFIIVFFYLISLLLFTFGYSYSYSYRTPVLTGTSYSTFHSTATRT